MFKIKKVIVALMMVFLLCPFVLLAAEDSDLLVDAQIQPVNHGFHVNLDAGTIAKGYTVAAFNDEIKLSLVPGILSSSTAVDVLHLQEEIASPWQLEKISEIYQFEFRNKAAYDNHKAFYIQFKYNQADQRRKQVFYFDKNYDGWRPLPTRDFPDENFVRSLIHLPFARIAVFAYPHTLADGRASWYAHKTGNFAASPDYPDNSRLRVYNKANGKFVDVVVNDHGPDRKAFPDRAIDLEKSAFARIASLGEGVIDVVVEPLYIAPEKSIVTQIEDDVAVSSVFKISALSGVILDEETGDVLWGKDEKTPLPIASLTKMLAMKVFLETNPDLDEIVKYSTNDRELNYEFCERKYSVAYLDLAEGQEISVRNLLYSSVVGSTNNTVETLVRVSGMKRSDFIKKMNKQAREWGAVSTVFYDPTGLSPQNVSSALDYAIMMKEVLEDPVLAKVASTKSFKHPTKDRNIENTNHLLRYGTVDNITGSKTGYLIEAGHCLMMRVETKKGSRIFVILGSQTSSGMFAEMKKMVQYGATLTLK